MAFTTLVPKCLLCNEPMDNGERVVFIGVVELTSEPREGPGDGGVPFGGPLVPIPEGELRIKHITGAKPRGAVHIACYTKAWETFPIAAVKDQQMWDMAGPFRIGNGKGQYRYQGDYISFGPAGKIYENRLGVITRLGLDATKYASDSRVWDKPRKECVTYLPGDWVVYDLGLNLWAYARDFMFAHYRRPRD